MKKISIITTVLLLIFSVINIEAKDKNKQIEQAIPGAGVTIYMDISAMGRKRRAADKMTDLHKKHFAKGWTVIDVDPYIENGDLQGFFITYVGRSNAK